jgi:uncharacterized protein YcfJ
MRHAARFLFVPALVLAACSSDKSNDKLNADLALAAQNTARMDSISAIERTRAQAAAPARAAQAPARSSSAPRQSSSPGTSTAAAPRTVEVKHGGRDAAIGAAAGAVIGATTSRDKLKGGLIGAAAGGIIGGVVGNNVDKQTKPAP